ncbi:MAG: hypothetical protein VZR24_16975 [Butyrivibrio hungatei]|nr:hypothetical protein [Butyrivibrio hungatei]
MIDTNNLVNKIYQHTGRKLDPSDPAVAQLAAQQLLIKDFELDLSEVLDDLDARLTKIYSSQQQKISQLTDSKLKNFESDINSHIAKLVSAETQKHMSAMNRIEKLIADNYRWIVLLSFMQLVMNGFLLYVLSK